MTINAKTALSNEDIEALFMTHMQEDSLACGIAFARAVLKAGAAREPGPISEVRTFIENRATSQQLHGATFQRLELAHNDLWAFRQLVDAAAARDQQMVNALNYAKEFEKHAGGTHMPAGSWFKLHETIDAALAGTTPTTPTFSEAEAKVAITNLYKYTNLHQESIESMQTTLLAAIGSAA